ncbi:hypothetical protein pEaSNUABM29_00182 [Erwinia phage pEa_SNUABM_29]|nr:hypothetical protein pEaSNUABM29_00182 [Erwinia phage pEa_SNUABM_29]
MKVPSELTEMCRDPFTLWTLCMLRRDEKFPTLVRDPEALKAYIVSEEERIQEQKEMSNKFDPQLVVLSRLCSKSWRSEHTLKGKTLPELVEALAAVLAKDNIIWPTLHNTNTAAQDVRITLTRCYFTFSK